MYTQEVRTAFHSHIWRQILSDTYGYSDSSYGYDTDKGVVAPSMIVNSWILRKRFLVSVPYGDEAGPLPTNGDERQVEAYFDYLDDIHKELKLDYMEIKGIDQSMIETAVRRGYQEIFENFTFRIDLTADENEIHRGFKSSVKGVLKKKNDWSIEVQVGDDSLIDEYYRMHQITMKKLGTPPHSKKFFANISELVGENSSFIYAFAEGIPIAAIIVIMDESKYCSRYLAAASDPAHRALNGGSFCLEEAIRLSKDKGFRYFDFGVSRPGGGVWNFKKRWTKTPPIKVHYMTKGESSAYIDPRNENIDGLSRLWRKMVPLRVANAIGPYVRGQVAK